MLYRKRDMFCEKFCEDCFRVNFFLVMVTPPFDLSLQIVSKDCVFSLIHDKWFRQMLAGFCTAPKTNLGLHASKIAPFQP